MTWTTAARTCAAFTAVLACVSCWLAVGAPSTFAGAPDTNDAVIAAGAAEPDAGLEALARRVRSSVVEILGAVEGTEDTSYGTGFVMRESNLVVTNAHVVRGVPQVMVRTFGGALLASVSVLHVDESVDLAVLRVIGLDARPLGAAELATPTVGTPVVTVGHPRGYEFTMSDGIVSALRALEDGGPTLIQTTVPISPGSSGGPLLDAQGQVVGVCSLTLMEGQNINFAVPVARVMPVLDRALAIERALQASAPEGLDEDAIVALARRHRAAGDLVRASDVVRRALEVRGSSVPLLIEAAEIAWTRGSEAEVEAILKRIERLSPGNADGRRIRAASLAQQGACDAAMVEARAVLDGGATPRHAAEAHAILADCLARQGNVALALSHVERALEDERIAVMPDYHALRALLLQSSGRPDDADREAILALELSEWNDRVVAMLRERGLPRVLEVTSFRHAREGDIEIVRGVVRHRGTLEVIEIRVTAEGVDASGRIVATGTSATVPDRLVPGQTASFRIALDGLVEDIERVIVRVIDYRDP